MASAGSLEEGETRERIDQVGLESISVGEAALVERVAHWLYRGRCRTAWRRASRQYVQIVIAGIGEVVAEVEKAGKDSTSLLCVMLC